MKKGYIAVIAALVVVCLVQSFALMRLARAEQAHRDDVSDFMDRAQKESRIMQDDFDRFFGDDFFRNTADPFKEMENIRKRMRSLMLNNAGNTFDDSWDTWFTGRFGGAKITVKTEDTKEAVIMHIRVPGLDRNNLAVTIDDDRVKIDCDVKETKEDKDANGRQTARYASQQRVTRILSLPPDVDGSKAVTKQEKDEIVITLPKTKAGKKI